MKKRPAGKKKNRTVSIGTVTVTKTVVVGNQVTVKVKASGITVPYPSPAVCTPVGAFAFLFRYVGSDWVPENPPSQVMLGDIVNGYETVFGPRAPGSFKATVKLSWSVTKDDLKDGFS